MSDNKTITDYFRSNIFEAYGAYLGWKILAASKSSQIVSQEMAERYVAIQNYCPNFFVSTQRAFLINFVLLALHPFDSDSRAFSLHKIDALKTKAFIAANIEVLDKLYDLRNKIFAHRDAGTMLEEYKIPSMDSLDQFFKNLMNFYNEITLAVDKSSTIFSNAEDIKYDIESLFMILYRGEQSRKQDFEVEMWKHDPSKVSDVL